jgi:hypothetical protein
VSLPLTIALEGVESRLCHRLVKRDHNNSRALDQLVQDGNGIAATPRNQDDLRFQQRDGGNQPYRAAMIALR